MHREIIVYITRYVATMLPSLAYNITKRTFCTTLTSIWQVPQRGPNFWRTITKNWHAFDRSFLLASCVEEAASASYNTDSNIAVWINVIRKKRILRNEKIMKKDDVLSCYITIIMTKNIHLQRDSVIFSFPFSLRFTPFRKFIRSKLT